MLLRHGANPVQVNTKGKSPLDVATNEDIVQLLRSEMIASSSSSSSLEEVRSPTSPESGLSDKEEPLTRRSSHSKHGVGGWPTHTRSTHRSHTYMVNVQVTTRSTHRSTHRSLHGQHTGHIHGQHTGHIHGQHTGHIHGQCRGLTCHVSRDPSLDQSDDIGIIGRLTVELNH